MPQNRPHLAYWLVGLLAVVTAALVTAALLGVTLRAAPPTSVGRGPGPSPSPSPSPSAEPEPESAILSDARAALRGSATISVIGDSTGDGPGEWVDVWAQQLADDDRRVALHLWANDGYQPAPLKFGGDGDETTIWNASRPFGRAGWAVGALDAVQPERPDLILLNVGHNNAPSNVAAQLNELRSDISQRWDGPSIPLVAILQNPGRGGREDRQAGTLRSIRTWATDEGVPTIDVTSAFTDLEKQMQDTVHPNEQGSRIWAEAVADALAEEDPDRGR